MDAPSNIGLAAKTVIPNSQKTKQKQKPANSAYIVKKASNKISNNTNYGRMPAVGAGVDTTNVHWIKMTTRLERVNIEKVKTGD